MCPGALHVSMSTAWKICQTDICNAWPELFLQCSATSGGTQTDHRGRRNQSTDKNQEKSEETGALLLSGVEFQRQNTSEPLTDEDQR